MALTKNKRTSRKRIDADVGMSWLGAIETRENDEWDVIPRATIRFSGTMLLKQRGIIPRSALPDEVVNFTHSNHSLATCESKSAKSNQNLWYKADEVKSTSEPNHLDDPSNDILDGTQAQAPLVTGRKPPTIIQWLQIVKGAARMLISIRPVGWLGA
jgi:hypothetical protein